MNSNGACFKECSGLGSLVSCTNLCIFQVDPQPCSSSGRTHKARDHIIPEDGESESSFNSDEEDTEDEEDR
jgi:hypothetical protein